MNFLKAIFNNKENKFKVGDSWNDYNFKTFIEFNKLQDSEDEFKREKIYSLFTDTPLDTWLKPHKPELFKRFDEQLNFLSEEPKTKLPTHIYRESKDKLYKINKEFREVKAGRYYNILNYVSTLSEESTTEETLEVMASCIAVCGLDIIYDTEDYEECVEEVIETMPADEAYTLGCFFLNKLKELNPNTLKTWSTKSLTMRIIRHVLAILIAILVGSLIYITSPKELLQIPSRLWSSQLVMFMRGKSMRVSILGVRTYTEI